MIVNELNPDISTGDQLSEELARTISSADEDSCVFVYKKVYKEDLYKDSAPCEVVFEYNGKLWSFFYSHYCSHYGMGEHTFYDCVLTEVEYYEETITTVNKGYRPV